MVLCPERRVMAGSSVSVQPSSPAVEFDKLRPFYEEQQFMVLGSYAKEKPGVLDRPGISSSFLPTRPTPFPAVAMYAFGNNGSKEDMFFDSQPWLDSDCEDDFFSVKGDFTPSCGNTPVHHSFKAFTSKPCISKNLPRNDQTSGPAPEHFPKKRLVELLRETRAEEEAERRKLAETVWLEAEELEGKMTALNIMVPERQKSGRCLPSLELCRSFSGRKKKVMIPAADPCRVV